MQNLIVIISVTADSSLLSPTGSVNRIPPDTAIHEQMDTQKTNGYVKSENNDKHTNNGETIVDNNMSDGDARGHAQHAELSTPARCL